MGIDDDVCLILDTSNRWVLTALASPHSFFEKSTEAPRQAFQLLPNFIQELCRRMVIQKPAWIVASIGPGSFTGVRLGVGFARNLGQLWQIPVLGIASLRFYCYDILCRKKDLSSIALMIDGKQGRIYGASMNRTSKSECALPQRENFFLVDQEPHIFLQNLKGNCTVFADDPERIAGYVPKSEAKYAKQIREMPKMPKPCLRRLYETALQNGGKKTASSWEKLLPLYLRSDPAHAKYPDGIRAKTIRAKTDGLK